jgi:hypothetical protein
LLERKTGQRLLRDDVFRDDDFLPLARPPRAPAVRTDMVPRPVLRDDDELRADDFRAVARPPFAPAFFFCAVVPARPPFAPAAFTDIVPRPLVFRADVELFFRAVVEAFLRGVADVDRDVERDFDREAVLVFLRDAVPPPRDELELDFALRDEDDFDVEDDFVFDFASPDFARCLLTVRAAISFARFVERPCFSSESLTCSYCRSRFALHDWGICVRPPRWFPGGQHMPMKHAVHARAISNGFIVGASTPPDFSIVTITCAPRSTRRDSVNVRPSNCPARRTSGSEFQASDVVPLAGRCSRKASTAVHEVAPTSSRFAP